MSQKGYKRDEEVETKFFDYASVEKKTEKAFLLTMESGEELWFPKSQCKLNERTSEVEVPKWMAVDKGLIEEDEE